MCGDHLMTEWEEYVALREIQYGKRAVPLVYGRGDRKLVRGTLRRGKLFYDITGHHDESN